jgi:transcriptional regulator with XRE-family HTH domain
LRKARDLTQERMAELLGVGQESISLLESRAGYGARPLDQTMIKALHAQPDTSERASTRKSLRGCLKQYAKPELMSQESSAWLSAVSEPDESR